MQEELFKRWLDEHKGLVFKVVMAYTESPADQDDLFQQILMQLWSSIPHFKRDAKETTWIYRVALNTALVWKRGQLRRRKRHSKNVINFDEFATREQNSTESKEKSQILAQVYEAIRKLPKVDSSLVLMYLDGLSYDEIADVLGISSNNVGVRLNRAKKKLAQLLKGLIDDV